jgi:hypothetical protein
LSGEFSPLKSQQEQIVIEKKMQTTKPGASPALKTAKQLEPTRGAKPSQSVLANSD